jgi:RNA polymerase sigma-70 factor (ECF subfamily)
MTDRRRRFEAEALVHLDAAYNLARWLARSPAEADDVVQDALVKAYRGFDALRGEARPWLLAIVRNCFYTARARREREPRVGDDEARLAALPDEAAVGPLDAAIREQEVATLAEALGRLAPEYREVLVLREIEDLSYREIADVAGVPIGTVMSRLARARAALARIHGGEDGVR